MRACASGSTPGSQGTGVRGCPRPAREQRRATSGPAGQHDGRCPVARRVAARPSPSDREPCGSEGTTTTTSMDTVHDHREEAAMSLFRPNITVNAHERAAEYVDGTL